MATRICAFGEQQQQHHPARPGSSSSSTTTTTSTTAPPSPPASPPPPPPPCRPVTAKSSIMDILHARSGSRLDRSAHVKQQSRRVRRSQLASHVINWLDSRFCLKRTEVMRHCIQQDEMVTSPTSPPQLKHAGRKCCPDLTELWTRWHTNGAVANHSATASCVYG